jgi:hypothetical protein
MLPLYHDSDILFREGDFCLARRFFQSDKFHTLINIEVPLEYIDIIPSLKIDSPLKNLPAAADSHGFPLDIDTLPPDIGRLPTDIDTLPSDIDRLPTDIDPFPPDIAGLPTDIDPFPPDIDRLPTDIDSFPADIDRLPTDIVSFPPDIDRLPTDIDSFPPDIDGLPTERPSPRVESNKSSNVNEKRRFKMGCWTRKLMETLLKNARRAITNALAYLDIQEKILRFGYDAAKLNAGHALYKKAQSLYIARKTKWGLQLAATKDLIDMIDAVYVYYMDYAKLVRKRLKRNKEALTILGFLEYSEGYKPASSSKDDENTDTNTTPPAPVPAN